MTLHAPYTRDEVLAALGHWTRRKQPEMREGVLHLPDLRADVFFVTLQKTEKDYSPTTMYQDYAINERLFHWQSQSTTSAESPTGRRYIEHAERGYTVLLFGRESKSRNGLAQPYFFLGPARYVDHSGSRPMSITWRLEHPLPARLFRSLPGLPWLTRRSGAIVSALAASFPCSARCPDAELSTGTPHSAACLCPRDSTSSRRSPAKCYAHSSDNQPTGLLVHSLLDCKPA